MEPEKKFKNLSLQYRNYLDEVNKILISYNPKIKYSFIDINNYYRMINDINNKLLILENDIHHLFTNYEKTNDTIYKLKNLLKQRNKIIIRNLLTSKKYKDYVNKLSQDNKRSIKSVEDTLTELMKKYSMTWKCCWSFLEIDDNGNPKNINLFDINDILFFKQNLHIKQ
jgi:predicted  nucleic acid-binding Zn-ribbon protein